MKGAGGVVAAASCFFKVAICFFSFWMTRAEALGEAASTLGIRV
jgi:hypothetical protein